MSDLIILIGNVLGYFTSDSDLKKVFTKTANALREKSRFAHTSDDAVMTDQGHKEYVYIWNLLKPFTFSAEEKGHFYFCYWFHFPQWIYYLLLNFYVCVF